MCNPRKVMIHLTRSIEQAWRRTVEETATASGEVTELARITADIALDEEMGDLALDMLERVLAGDFEGFEPWERNSLGHYRCDLDQVILVYNPDTRQISVEAQLTELISTEARGAADASGFTVGKVAAEAVAHYYDDGWGGRTEEVAKADAQAKAQQRLDQAIEALHNEQNPEQLEAAKAEAQDAAEAAAAQALAERQAEVRAALREQLQYTLAQAQNRVREVMNRAVGEAYRQSLRQLVLDNGGRVLVDESTGSIINMELELY